ncbi:MAG: 3-deoxy-8-phosphooctulonate synthase [Myxococcales bacterium]|nr:3-deoxy-8-phosphooctulonate synthase [Myxococcales bacterium]
MDNPKFEKKDVSGVHIGGTLVTQRSPLILIAGPCVVESESLVLEIAQSLVELTAKLKLPFVFKASFEKANRTSGESFRGVGLERGLKALEEVKRQTSALVLTDVHEDTPIDEVAAVVDVLQTPAFLCRQTNYLERVARAGLPVHVKKGQFLAPQDMQHVVQKLRSTGNDQVMVCERGVSFGYHNLVVDMRALGILRGTGCPVTFDATHSVQRPGGLGDRSGGDRQMIPLLARAAVAAGVAGLFMETHPRPGEALSDGPNSWPLARMGALLESVLEIDSVVKRFELLEESAT